VEPETVAPLDRMSLHLSPFSDRRARPPGDGHPPSFRLTALDPTVNEARDPDVSARSAGPQKHDPAEASLVNSLDRVDRANSHVHTPPGTLRAWGRGKLQEGKKTMSGYDSIVVYGPYRLPEIRELEGRYED
jgi:hypothetical protein